MNHLFLILALAAPAAPASSADVDADARARVSDSEYVFEDDDVDGELPQDDHVAIRGHGGARFPSMVQGRAHFLDRMHAQALDI